ncbi:hypothetical protein GCM10027443_35390 [Pontibacter brevis]
MIRLLDEKQHLIAVWKVSAAWPTKVEGPGLASGGNEVVVETIELAHEGLCIEGE